MLQLVRCCVEIINDPSVVACFGLSRPMMLCNWADVWLRRLSLLLLGGLLLCLQVLTPARTGEFGQKLADSLLVDLVLWVFLGAQLLSKPCAGLEENQV